MIAMQWPDETDLDSFKKIAEVLILLFKDAPEELQAQFLHGFPEPPAIARFQILRDMEDFNNFRDRVEDWETCLLEILRGHLHFTQDGSDIVLASDEMHLNSNGDSVPVVYKILPQRAEYFFPEGDGESESEVLSSDFELWMLSDQEE